LFNLHPSAVEFHDFTGFEFIRTGKYSSRLFS